MKSMSNSEQYWQYQQEQPTAILIVGNAKRWGLLELPPTGRVVDLQDPVPEYGKELDNRNQDEHLALYGAG